jgi:hypothetical protein
VKRPLGRAHAVGKNLEILESRENACPIASGVRKNPFCSKRAKRLAAKPFAKFLQTFLWPLWVISRL